MQAISLYYISITFRVNIKVLVHWLLKRAGVVTDSERLVISMPGTVELDLIATKIVPKNDPYRWNLQ